MDFTVENDLEARRSTARAHVVRRFERLDHARAIELRDVGRAEVERRDDRNLLVLIRIVQALHAHVRLEGSSPVSRLLVFHTGPPTPPPDRVLVVERPPVEKIDVVAAVHPRAGPHRDFVVRALRIQIAKADHLIRVAGEVEERREERERRDDARLDPLVERILTAELDLRVAAFVDDARTEGDDVRAAAGAAAQIRSGVNATIRAKLEVTFVRRLRRLLHDVGRLVAAGDDVGRRRARDGRGARVGSDRRIGAHRYRDGWRRRGGGGGEGGGGAFGSAEAGDVTGRSVPGFFPCAAALRGMASATAARANRIRSRTGARR